MQSRIVKLLINLAVLAVIIGVIYIFKDQITESSFYKDWLKSTVDWLLGMIGMAPAEEVAEAAS